MLGLEPGQESGVSVPHAPQLIFAYIRTAHMPRAELEFDFEIEYAVRRAMAVRVGSLTHQRGITTNETTRKGEPLLTPLSSYVLTSCKLRISSAGSSVLSRLYVESGAHCPLSSGGTTVVWERGDEGS